MISPFCTPILFALPLASDMMALYGNDAFSILVLTTKKRYSSFLKKVFVLQKICFKVKVLKTFKISTDCHIKACLSCKRRTILKIPGTVLEEPMLFPLVLKWNLEEITFSSVKTKTNPNFGVKFAERSNHTFLLSVWWIKFFKHLHSSIRDNGIYRI